MRLLLFLYLTQMYVSQAGVSTMALVSTRVIPVSHGPTPVQSAKEWGLTYPLLKVRKRMSTFNTDTMVKRPGSVWMTLLSRDYSPGWMDVLINSATGQRVNQMTFGGRTAYTLLVPGTVTCGMMWIVLLVINIHAKRVWNDCLFIYLFLMTHILI